MEPPREGRALSTWGFLSFQLLGPPSLVDSRGSGQTRPCKVGGVRWVGEPLPRPGGGGEDRGRGKVGPPPRALPEPRLRVQTPSHPEWGPALPRRAREGGQHREGSAQPAQGRHCCGDLRNWMGGTAAPPSWQSAGEPGPPCTPHVGGRPDRVPVAAAEYRREASFLSRHLLPVA